ncbi:MAG: FixH family protein, partial [Candidatus Nitrosotenuis sp.]
MLRNNKNSLNSRKTLKVDGQEYVLEDQFAWGLVSVNTQKSIYRPGETADLVIVVLDNGGHPVCDSNISLTVTDPNLQNTTLSSGNGITANSECGLYDASYTTGMEGNYTIHVQAQTPNGITNFDTEFTVKSVYDYDIIRTAQSKIDPVTNPNLFNVTIDIESFVGSNPVTIKEHIPNVFDVITDGTVEEGNGTKTITWIRGLDQNKTSVSYSYSIPLEFPRLYALGKVEIIQNNQTFVEARNWYVAADPPVISEESAIAAYISTTGSGMSFPKIRVWDSSGTGTWKSEVELASAGSAVTNTIIKYSPTTNRIILVTMSTDDKLDAYVCDGNCTTASNWSVTNDIGTGAADLDIRQFDVDFETKTGDAILVYSGTSSSTSQDIAYRVLSASSTTWGSEQYIDDTGHATDIQYRWLDLDRNPVRTSEELVLVGFDFTNKDINAWVWNGSAWGNQREVSASATATSNDKALAVAYASDGSIAMVVGADGTSGNVNNERWNGSTWTSGTPFDIDTGGSEDLRWITLKADPSSDDMQAVLVDSANDLGTAYWSGSAWTVTSNIDTALDSSSGDSRPADFAWHPTGSTGQLVWDTDGSGTTLAKRNCTPQCTASTTTSSTYAGTGEWLSLYTNPRSPDSVDILGIRKISGTSPDLGSFRIVTTTLTNYGDTQLTADTDITNAEGYSLDFRKPAKKVVLTESIGIKDQVTKNMKKVLGDKVGIKDTFTKSSSKSLTEKLGVKDSVRRTLSVSPTEKLGIRDTVVKITTKSLTEKLGIKDTLTKTATKSLTEKLGIKDTLTRT